MELISLLKSWFAEVTRPYTEAEARQRYRKGGLTWNAYLEAVEAINACEGNYRLAAQCLIKRVAVENLPFEQQRLLDAKSYVERWHKESGVDVSPLFGTGSTATTVVATAAA